MYTLYLNFRHVGDLGNVEEANGAVQTSLSDSIISLDENSNRYIIGRAMVVSNLLRGPRGMGQIYY